MAIAVATALPAAAEGKIVDAGGPDAVPDSYIVVYKQDAVTTQTDSLAAKANAKVEHRYTAALKGFAGTMTEVGAKKLAAEPSVDYVAQNHVVTKQGDQPNPPSWGLDRIDQRRLPLDSNYHYESTAANVNAYVIDTGIRTTHVDFGGRATFDFNAVDTDNSDCNGHGTHVAGTIGGTQYGVAKSVRLHAVKVLDCGGNGTIAGVAAGVDWVTANKVKPAVANMSLGGGANAVLDTAVRNSIASGVTYAIASGNFTDNACNYSPARVAEAITVNASTIVDTKADFSNFGSCTDLFAPGQDITSAWGTGDTATNTISGTSMATPHVAGAAALYLADNPNATPKQVRDRLVGVAAYNRIADPGANTENLLLFSGIVVAPVPAQDLLLNGETLQANQTRTSANGGYVLVMQGDGNLVLYTSNGVAQWATNSTTTGAVAASLRNGNLVLTNAAGTVVWSSGTQETTADRLVVQNDGNLVLYGPNGKVFWHRFQ
ncbi:S8 family serine peptidase [Umezawaea tangerina]|nr:S8 family serine peptidase [Umezawaea tangerina]